MSRPVSTGTPVYQIDFTAVACGKRVASSKRRVRWRFGFANLQALEAGRTGTDCRGAEHDVTFVWSLSSGKRTVLFDGQEVHYSSSRSGIFDYSWTMRGTNHVLKIVAHATPPMTTTPGFRQYDFFVDGRSFFRFPKLFRIGLNPNDPRASAGSSRDHSLAQHGSRYKAQDEVIQAETPGNPDEEEAYLQEAIRQSLQNDVTPQAAPASTDLLGFDSPPPPPPPSSAPFTSVGSNDYMFGAPSQQATPQYPPAYFGTGNPFGQAPHAQQQQLALPPSTTADPWAAAPTPPPTNRSDYYHQQQPHHQAGYGAPQPSSNQLVPASSAASPYAIAAPNTSNSNGFGPPRYSEQPTTQRQPSPAISNYPAQQQQTQAPAAQYGNISASYGGSGGGQTTEGSGYVASNPSLSQWTPPPPIVTTNGYGMPPTYAAHQQQPDIPQAFTPQAASTPSTLGFGSPAANFAGFGSPEPALGTEKTNDSGDEVNQWDHQPQQHPGPQSTLAESIGQYDGKNAGSGGAQEKQASSLVDDAYSKLVNFESFSISSKSDAPRSNPFELSSNIGGTKSLADMKATKTSVHKKEVMKTPVPAQAMVVAEQQAPVYGTHQQPAYGQTPALYAQPAAQQQPVQYAQAYAQQPVTQQQVHGALQPTFGQQLSQSRQGLGQAQFPFMQQPSEQLPPQHSSGFGQQASMSQLTYEQQPMVQQQQGQTPYGQSSTYF